MKIATVNIYVGNKQRIKDIDFLEKKNIDVIGFQEAKHVVELLRARLDDYKVVKAKRSNSEGAREVAVALDVRDKENTYLGHKGWEVSELRPGEGGHAFHSRWLTVLRFEHKGRKCVLLNHHGNAAVQDRRTGNLLRARRVVEWSRGMKALSQEAKSFQAKGYDVFVTGDFNYRNRGNHKLAFLSPQRVFKRRNLAWVDRGVDYVAYPKHYTRKGVEILDNTGSDHPWIIVDVQPCDKPVQRKKKLTRSK